MAPNRESLSEQSKKRTNRLLLILGIVLFLLLLLAWCRMRPEPQIQVEQRDNEFEIISSDPQEIESPSLPNYPRGDAQLMVVPSEVVMTPNVVIGSEAVAPITLRAANAPIILDEKKLAEDDPEGFVLSGPCMELDRLEKDQECILKVSWTPKKLRNIANTLTIVWREDSHSVFEKERTSIQLKAQSTDSKDCVVC